jgi:hypothetical protein
MNGLVYDCLWYLRVVEYLCLRHSSEIHYDSNRIIYCSRIDLRKIHDFYEDLGLLFLSLKGFLSLLSNCSAISSPITRLIFYICGRQWRIGTIYLNFFISLNRRRWAADVDLKPVAIYWRSIIFFSYLNNYLRIFLYICNNHHIAFFFLLFIIMTRSNLLKWLNSLKTSIIM